MPEMDLRANAGIPPCFAGPSGQVDLRTLREKGQLTFFDDEDGFGNKFEGLCGV